LSDLELRINLTLDWFSDILLSDLDLQ